MSKMKQIISCIMTIVLSLSLVTAPSVRAESPGTTTYQYDGYSIDYQVKSHWDGNQTVEVKIANTGTEPILNWAVKYDAGGIITDLANAEIYKQTDNLYILKNSGYNYEILPDQSTSFNYTVTGDDLVVPEDIKLITKRSVRQDGYDVQYHITDDWETGFQAAVTITNSTDIPIEAWALTFHGDFTIGNLWDASLVNSSVGFHTIASTAWTNVIPENSSVTFGFIGSKNADTEAILDDFSLTEMIVSDEPEYPDDGIIDQADIENLLALGKIEAIRGDDGSFRVIDGTFTGQRVTSVSSAAILLNSAGSLFGDGFNADASGITVQHLDADGEAKAENFYRYSPSVNSVPVLGSQIVLTANGYGTVTGLFNTYENGINHISTVPTVTEQRATSAATDRLLSDGIITASLQRIAEASGYDYDIIKNEFLSTLTIDTKLLIYAASDDDSTALTWTVDLNTRIDPEDGDVDDNGGDVDEDPDGEDSDGEDPDEPGAELPVMPYISETVYVYANGSSAGSVLNMISNSEAWSSVTLEETDLLGNSRTIEAEEENDKYRLRDNRRNIETYKTKYGELFWLEPKLPGELISFKKNKTPSKTAVSAHANMETVYDFYLDILDMKSFNGDKAIKTSIDYDKSSWLPGTYENAEWNLEHQQMVFGNKGNLAAALDVVGHEFTHAVINHIVVDSEDKSLIYYGESGALNESYADIMGSLIENKSGDNRWIMGEDSDSAIRNMANPARYDQPEHYDEWYTAPSEYDDNDNGGVHINSGIFNLSAYRMMVDSRTKTISNATWAKVFYRSLFHLTTTATFLDARGAIIAEAKGLHFDGAQQQAIKDAFNRTGIKESESIRIVLRWGASPYDLDSHLVGPAVNGNGKFHIYYGRRSYYQDGSYSSDKAQYVADLDYDDVSSYGPEIITIHKLTPGDYYFYVHDFSNLTSSTSTALARLGANVKVYSGSSGTPIETYEADSISAGNLWSVFKLNISLGGRLTFTPINGYSYNSNPSSVGN